MKKIIKIQFGVLCLGTVFAWTNFIIELVDWLNKKACTTGCTVGLVNPFKTPCFFGALFFLLAFSLSVVLLNKIKENNYEEK